MRVRTCAVLLLTGFALNAQPGSEKEAALGKQLAAGILKQAVPIDNEHVQRYLDRVGQRLAACTPSTKFPFQFTLIANDACPLHEPYAYPGGYVIVSAALFTAAADEAEFAGVLAHAMQHVALRHYTRGAVVNSTNVPLIFMGALGCGGASPLLAVHRQAELEADAAAVETLACAGFDATALARYVERGKASVPGRDQRLAAMSSALEKLSRVEYSVVSSDGFVAVQRELRSPEARTASKPAPSLMR